MTRQEKKKPVFCSGLIYNRPAVKKKKKKEAGKCYTYKSRDVENEVNGLWPSKRKITHTYTSGNFCQWVAHKGFLEHALPENMRGL